MTRWFHWAGTLSLLLFAGTVGFGALQGLSVERGPPKLRFNNHLHVGDFYLQTGNFALAAREYRRASDMDHGDFNAAYRHGVAAAGLGDSDAAVAAFERALHVNPTCVECRHRLGLVYLGDVRVRDAIAEFERALAIDPRSAPVLSSLGAAYGQIGEYVMAEKALVMALRLSPGLESAQANLQMVRKAALDRAPRQEEMP